MKFIVDRKTWFRGQGSDQSRLLNTNGQRCCIGFVGQQCGISDAQLAQKKTVGDCQRKQAVKFPTWMRVRIEWDRVSSSPAVGDAYNINDDQSITDDQREAKLKTLFLEYGDEIEFIN